MLSKTEKIILAYLAVGVAVRLSKRSVSTAINTETFIGTALLWPYVLVAGYSGIPVTPPAVSNESAPVTQNATVNA